MDLQPSTERAFTRTCEELVAGVAGWTGDDATADVADLVLTGRFAMDDWHDLTRWSPELVTAILLDWMPHSALVNDEYVEIIPTRLATFLRYLHEVHDVALDLSADTWEAALTDLLPHVHAAVEEAGASPGPARQLVEGMLGDGVDLGDEAAMATWIDDYNATVLAEGPEAGVRPPGIDDAPGWGHLSPVVPPARDVLEAQVRAAPLLQQLDSFLDWIGDGQAVTKTGNLKVADGYELVDRLGTDDLAPIGGMPRPRVQSAAELTDVDWVYTVARTLGLVTTTATRLYAQPDDDTDLLDRWEQVWLAVLGIGPLDHLHRGHRTPLAGHVVDMLDASIVEVLLGLHQADGDVAIDDLVEDVIAQAALGRQYDEGTWELFDRWVERDVRALLDRLAEVGVVEVAGVSWEDGWYGPDPVGGTVWLTGLGTWALSRVDGAFAGDDITEVALDDLLDVIDTSDEELLDHQLGLWAAANPDAVDDVAAAVRRGPSGGMVELGFALLHHWGPDAVPQVRTLVDEPEVGALARVFLARHGDEDAVATLDVDAPAAMIDVLASILDVFGPEAMSDEVDGLGPPHELGAMFDRLWRTEHDDLERVLETVGKFHRDKAVAKAARKALFKHRSART